MEVNRRSDRKSVSSSSSSSHDHSTGHPASAAAAAVEAVIRDLGAGQRAEAAGLSRWTLVSTGT